MKIHSYKLFIVEGVKGTRNTLFYVLLLKKVHGKVCFHKNGIVIRFCSNKGNLESKEAHLPLARLYCPQCKARQRGT